MSEHGASIKDLIAAGNKFIISAEYVPLPGHKLSNFEKFLTGYAEKKDQLPGDIVVEGLTIPQSPSGVASMSPADIFAVLDKKGLWSDLDIMAHVTCKDMNVDAIKSYLVGLQKLGIRSVLALTGDNPVSSKGVFEIESIGLIKLIKEMNNQAYDRAMPGTFDKVHQFFVAAAVSQYKYTEASQMQQYYKMAKKVKAGADCLITQLGWDWRKCEELFRYMKEEGIDAPVMGNVYTLTTMTPAPRLMYEGKLMGCVVTKELFEKLGKESPDQQIERAAQQMAMFRNLGAVGVDLGGLMDFDMLLEIVQKAKEIGSNWRDYADNLDFGVKDGFYLYDSNGNRRQPSRPKAKFSKKNFNFFHKTLFKPGKRLNRPLAGFLGLSKGMREGTGGMTHFFHSCFEKPMKSLLFHCEDCGDCFLEENFSLCTFGRCEKGLDNAPCGDANPDGTCGNNPDISCVGEFIYKAAASEGEQGLKKLAATINPPRNPSLEGTASILNNLFGRDHTRKRPLIQIGESLHASIPKPGAAMKELIDAGDDAYEKPSGALSYLISIISSQAQNGADYIAINVDAFGEDDPQASVELMRKYVRLVRKYSMGIPVCIDSSDDNVLKGGLEEWYKDAPADIAKPLVNSVKTYTMDTILPLGMKYPCKMIGLLVDDQVAGTDGSYAVEDLYNMARKIFDAATGKYNYQPDDLFLDSTVFPLAIDMPMMPDTPGYTYRAFEAIRKIMTDPTMKGVHTSLGISNCTRDLPGRKIGICRAYVAKAMEYGLDAGIVNVMHKYGMKPVAPDLLEMVNAFAKQDGSAENSQKAMELMGAFCQANRKVKR
ncbi:MAG: methylenetetrahydrofolate reductase C-terminal domain-containing protein [Phycisphaerae bacterium]|nr:methylenetetrahydrofolate reductase C-terminal domain-containing protein [Phycisphaerae bacterium]